MKKYLGLFLVLLMSLNSVGESKNKDLPFKGFFYTTGKTIRFYNLNTNISKMTYSSQADEIDGLYYDSEFFDLYFTEMEYRKSNDGNILDTTYIVRKLNVKTRNVSSIIYKETRSNENLNYYLFPEYRYNDFLLFDIEGFESSYHKVFDLQLKEFILTTGESLYSSYFLKDENVYIHNYNDNNTYHEYVQIKLEKPIKSTKLTEEEFIEFAKKDFKYLNLKVQELPTLKDYPKDYWGNISNCWSREGNILILITFFSKTSFIYGGENSYLGNTITFYNLNNKSVIENITLNDFIKSNDVLQPFCLKK